MKVKWMNGIIYKKKQISCVSFYELFPTTTKTTYLSKIE